jgi:hypothetical protein
MTIHILPRPATAPMFATGIAPRTTGSRIIVAPEGSDLASRLRSTGWIARAGWRSHAAGRPAIWLVRFESPFATQEAAA